MRRMYSKKQLEELISEMSGDILEVKNVKQLNDEQCNGLKVGDIVAKKTGSQYHCYIVTYKQAKHGLCLSYFDASVIETQSYDYTEGHWVYNSEDKTELGGSGLPEVTSADNEKVLEVIAGAWGIGRKKVSIMDAPSSTTLTDEQVAQISEGVFINGSFLGAKNPVLFPYDTIAGVKSGIMIVIDGYISYVKSYYITSANLISASFTFMSFEREHVGDPLNLFKLINLKAVNGKIIPPYPANADIGSLICRKGTLEYYIPVAQNNITSGDTIALDSNLGKALLDHLDVEINGFRARYEYTDGNYVVYSSKTETAVGLKLQINMISYNTTNGELSFNQMTFTPDA